jgi:hypothetical protein
MGCVASTATHSQSSCNFNFRLENASIQELGQFISQFSRLPHQSIAFQWMCSNTNPFNQVRPKRSLTLWIRPCGTALIYSQGRFKSLRILKQTLQHSKTVLLAGEGDCKKAVPVSSADFNIRFDLKESDNYLR